MFVDAHSFFAQMAKSKNYYRILGLTEQATAEEIKKSFRRLAREHHPDHNPDQPDAEERFKAIQEAYDVLSDPNKRREYDRYRMDPFASFQAANGDHFQRAPDGSYVRYRRTRQPAETDGDSSLGGFTNFISRIFGAEEEPRPSSGRSGRRHSKLDIDTRLRLTFAQALRGGKTEVTLPHGEIVRIDIPKGVRSGFKIRIKGKGKIGPSSVGDLYVKFEVEPHAYYRRRGDDLHITLTINPIEAIVGVTRHVISAYGNRIKVKIPAGTQHGTSLRLKGQGVEKSNKTGDMYVKVELHVPENLTEEQLLEIQRAARKANLI